MTEDASMFEPLTDDEVTATSSTSAAAPQKHPIVPVPDDAPAMTFKHPKFGQPVRTWEYRDADGRLCGYAGRFEFTTDGQPDKDVLPITFCDLGNGKRAWRSKGIPAPRPLYRLPQIIERPDALVLVTEGEKAADAAATLFPDMVVTTPMHGAKSPHKTDWTPLAGRTVVIAPDNDDAGESYAGRVRDELVNAGAAEVLHLSPLRINPEAPEGWDLADALDEGWTADKMDAERAAADFFEPFPVSEDEAAGRSPFRVSESGVEKKFERVDKETGTVTIEWKWFCSELHVEAETRSSVGEEWGRLLRIVDRDGRTKRWAMPMQMMAGDGTAYRERLLSLGLILAPGKFARDALHEYVATARPRTRARCVTRTGFEGTTFTTPASSTDARNGSREKVIFQSPYAVDHAYNRAGTLEEWQQNVGRVAVGNSRLVLAISAAFAGPLLHLTHGESGGFHFRGGSSTGKTTALVAAGSVWGGGGIRGWVRSWRATSNGLEGVCALHNDGLLCLDEMGQVDAKEAGQVAYMLANGAGKLRAGRGGEARKPAEWRLIFLSSGEVGLQEKMAEDGRGRRVAAGQQVRVIDIAADAGAGMGMFENLHEFPDADTFARHVKTASSTYYGTAIYPFLQFVVDDMQGCATEAAAFAREFVEEHCPAEADGQIKRVCARFGLAAAAGEMATAFRVLPWEPGEATKGAVKCFADWLAARGGVEPAEEREAVAAVRRFIELHGASRFEPMGSLIDPERDYRIHNRVGFKRPDGNEGLEYLIMPESWKSEVCAGMDPTAAARALHKRGLLRAGTDGKLTNKQRLPGSKNPVRVYVIASDIIGDDHG